MIDIQELKDRKDRLRRWVNAAVLPMSWSEDDEESYRTQILAKLDENEALTAENKRITATYAVEVLKELRGEFIEKRKSWKADIDRMKAEGLDRTNRYGYHKAFFQQMNMDIMVINKKIKEIEG